MYDVFVTWARRITLRPGDAGAKTRALPAGRVATGDELSDEPPDNCHAGDLRLQPDWEHDQQGRGDDHKRHGQVGGREDVRV